MSLRDGTGACERLTDSGPWPDRCDWMSSGGERQIAPHHASAAVAASMAGPGWLNRDRGDRM
jgi:hypothetical protein